MTPSLARKSAPFASSTVTARSGASIWAARSSTWISVKPSVFAPAPQPRTASRAHATARSGRCRCSTGREQAQDRIIELLGKQVVGRDQDIGPRVPRLEANGSQYLSVVDALNIHPHLCALAVEQGAVVALPSEYDRHDGVSPVASRARAKRMAPLLHENDVHLPIGTYHALDAIGHRGPAAGPQRVSDSTVLRLDDAHRLPGGPHERRGLGAGTGGHQVGATGDGGREDCAQHDGLEPGPSSPCRAFSHSCPDVSARTPVDTRPPASPYAGRPAAR